MRLNIKKKTSPRVSGRMTKKVRIRKKISGSSERPRLCVYRSGKHMYAQIINDTTGTTLLSTSSLGVEGKSGKELAKHVGSEVAKAALAKNIKSVVFDRNGFIYHGRIQALADGARESGLSF